MRTIIFVFTVGSLILFSSSKCSDKKKNKDNGTQADKVMEGNSIEIDNVLFDENPSRQGPVTGEVTTDFYSSGCNFLIRILDGENEKKELLLQTVYFPVALDSSYLVNGLKMKFTFIPSKAFSGACTRGMPIVLSDIEVIERP